MVSLYYCCSSFIYNLLVGVIAVLLVSLIIFNKLGIVVITIDF